MGVFAAVGGGGVGIDVLTGRLVAGAQAARTVIPRIKVKNFFI
jgi:hypothetical protein